jgi:ankyrin repeat protein
MNMLKTLFAVVALSFSVQCFALTDDESVEFADALTSGNLKTVQKYVKQEPEVVNNKIFAWSPIQMAANNDRLDVIKFLVEKGAEKDYQHPLTKMTAFHLAAYDGFEDVVKYLAAQGANVNLKMKGDVSILRAVNDEGNVKMAELLTSLGVKNDGCEVDCN